MADAVIGGTYVAGRFDEIKIRRSGTQGVGPDGAGEHGRNDTKIRSSFVCCRGGNGGSRGSRGRGGTDTGTVGAIRRASPNQCSAVAAKNIRNRVLGIKALQPWPWLELIDAHLRSTSQTIYVCSATSINSGASVEYNCGKCVKMGSTVATLLRRGFGLLRGRGWKVGRLSGL